GQPPRRQEGAVEVGQDGLGRRQAGALRPGGGTALRRHLAEAVPAALGGDDLPQLQLQAALGGRALRGRVGAPGPAARPACARRVAERESEAAVSADRVTAVPPMAKKAHELSPGWPNAKCLANQGSMPHLIFDKSFTSSPTALVGQKTGAGPLDAHILRFFPLPVFAILPRRLDRAEASQDFFSGKGVPNDPQTTSGRRCAL